MAQREMFDLVKLDYTIVKKPTCYTITIHTYRAADKLNECWYRYFDINVPITLPLETGKAIHDMLKASNYKGIFSIE